jgi:hypothetical protein
MCERRQGGAGFGFFAGAEYSGIRGGIAVEIEITAPWRYPKKQP